MALAASFDEARCAVAADERIAGIASGEREERDEEASSHWTPRFTQSSTRRFFSSALKVGMRSWDMP